MAFKSFIVTLALLAVVGHSVAFEPLLESHLRYLEPLQKTQIIWDEKMLIGTWANLDVEFKVIKYLASGGFSDIYLADDLITGQKNIILKKMAKSFYFKPDRWNDAEKELAIMQRLPKHPNICGFNRFVQDATHLYYSLENCGSSNVWKYAQSQKWLTEKEARRIFKQALTAMDILHSHKIFHLDFTEANMFYDESTGLVKIGDFGLSISTDEKVSPKFGTPGYFTPERQNGTPLRPSGVDIWYMGIGIYRVITGNNPFGLAQSPAALSCMKQAIYVIPKDKSPELLDLFKQIYKLDDERITLTELKVHPWFTTLD